MLRYIQNYFTTITPMYVDGALYVSIAFFGALAALFGSDDAAKYLSPETLFWSRGGNGSLIENVQVNVLCRSFGR